MANLQFLRGSQANLNNLKETSKIEDGAFYLTEDTHRLYVGQGTDLVELNKSVTVVETLTDLPTSNVEEGQFYYVSNINVLCVYQNGGWTQINPDTSIQNVSLNSIDTESYNKVETIINITETITHDENNEEAENKGAFGIKQTFIGENISLKTDNQAGEETDETSANGTITIIGDTYDISTQTIEHTYSETTPGEKELVAYNTTVDVDFNRNIAIDEKGNEKVVTEKIRFTGENGISLTSKEDAGAVSEIIIEGTSIDRVATSHLDENDYKGIEIAVYDSRIGEEGKTATAFVPTISYGKKNKDEKSSTLAEVRKGTGYSDDRPVYDFELNVYTINEIDSMLDIHTRTADAMRYKGAVEAVEDLPVENVQIGDTYKMNNEYPIIERDGGDTGNIIRIIKAGDIFIASGENKEDEKGFITVEEGKSIIWDHISAGDDTYKGYTVKEDIFDEESGELVSTQMNLTLANGENLDEKVATIGVRASDKLEVVYSTKNEGEDSLIYTIKHSKQEVPDDNSKKVEIDQTTFNEDEERDNDGSLTLNLPVLAIDKDGKLKCDEYGHITGYETKIINLTHNHLKSVSTKAENPSDNTKRAITYIKTEMEDAGDEKETYFELNTSTNSNIEFSTTTNEESKTSSTTINLVWGTF